MKKIEKSTKMKAMDKEKLKESLIIERFVDDNNRDLYTINIRSTIKQNEGLTGDEYWGAWIKVKGKQKVNDNLDIYIDNLTLYFDYKDKEIKKYPLKIHPKLENFWLVDDFDLKDRKQFLEICNHYSETGKNHSKTRDW